MTDIPRPAPGDTDWVDWADDEEAMSDSARLLVANAVRRVIHNGTAYPARPTDAPAGFVEYIGPTEPTTWLNGDTWIQRA